MTPEIAFMLAVLAAALAAFVWEAFPIEVTALGLLAVLLAAGLVDPADAVVGFSNKAVIAIGSLFILSHALMKTRVLEVMADTLSLRAAQRSWLPIAVTLGGVSLLSAFLNNTAVVALFIPLALNLCARLGLSPTQVLIPISYASIFGGTLTLIGTSTNLLVNSLAEEAGEARLGMFEFTLMGLVFVALGLSYVVLFARRLLPERADPGSLTERYRMGAYLTEVQVPEDSQLAGRTVTELGVNERYDIMVLAILRGDRRLVAGLAQLPLAAGDVLIVRGTMDSLLALRNDEGVALLPDIKLTDEELSSEEQVVVEGLVAPGSSLIGKTLKEVDFRRRYGAFVLAIRHLGRTMRTEVANARLGFADTLLMMVPRPRLEELRRSEDLFVTSELNLELRRGRLWWLVFVLLPGAVALAAVGWTDITTAAFVAAVVLLLAGAVTPREAYRAIDWSVLVLIAAFVPVGHAFVTTGTAAFIAEALLGAGALFDPGVAPYAVLALLYLVTSLTTQMVSNNAAAIILTPIALSVAATLEVDPRPYLFAICFAASAEFMTPMGYQTNMMVYGPGAYRFLDYTRFGAPLNLLFWLTASLLIPVFWPF